MVLTFEEETQNDVVPAKNHIDCPYFVNHMIPISLQSWNVTILHKLESKKKKSVSKISSIDLSVISPIGKNDYGLEDVCPRSASLQSITWTHTHSLLECFEAYLGCSSHHAYDPLQQFTFGITVEDTQMRLWFFARFLMSMVTHQIRLHHGEYHTHHIPVPFDSHFIKEFDIAIRIFIGLEFAGDESLGFDSTVSRILSRQPNTILYHHPLAGRSCCGFHTWPKDARVFEAHHESNASRSVVVKDVWLEDDRIQEGVHLENIRSATSQIQTKGTVFPGKRDPSTYFLTVVAMDVWKLVARL